MFPVARECLPHSRSTPMALKATIFKADLTISDIDRNHYQNYTLTLARHPSENDTRMMVRLLAFMRYADEALVFGKGLSSDEEPGRAGGGVYLRWTRGGNVVGAESIIAGKTPQADRIPLVAGKHSGTGHTGASHDDIAMHDPGRRTDDFRIGPTRSRRARCPDGFGKPLTTSLPGGPSFSVVAAASSSPASSGLSSFR